MTTAAVPDAGGLYSSPTLNANPRLPQWVNILSNGVVQVTPGKVELGQGITTALAQIVAEELEVSISRVQLLPARTDRSPDEGVTAGSLSVRECGMALRLVCATLRSLFLESASATLNVPVDLLSTSDGQIVAPSGESTSYWALYHTIDKDLPFQSAPVTLGRTRGMTRKEPVRRLDFPDKVFGKPRYIHDLKLPGMLHGRVLHAPRPGARLSVVDISAANTRSGVIEVVRDGDFIGVIALTNDGAKSALEKLSKTAVWLGGIPMPTPHDVPSWLQVQSADTEIVADTGPAADAPKTLTRTYSRPFLAHASIAPSCAIAQWLPNQLQVWTHSQGIFNLRRDLLRVFPDPGLDVVVEHVENAGCYGHNGADDVALDAALLARAVPGRPVRVQWSRSDELRHSPMGPAMVVRIEAGLTNDGEISHWQQGIWSNGHASRPGRSATPTLLAASTLSEPFERFIAANLSMQVGGGAQRNAIPIYDFPNLRIASHRILTMPIRTSSLRALGAYANVFAIESFLDEVAREGDVDPLEHRRKYIRDPRMLKVLDTAAAGFGWDAWEVREGFGRGLGCAQYKNSGAYCAVVAEVEMGEEVAVRRLVVAVDVGEVINPDGVINQIEGGAIQSTSWTLKEAVTFDSECITSDSWETYPILRFSEVPKVEVILVDNPNQPPVGAGEAAQGPTAAAIGNAVADALGVRVRHLPITRDQIISAMGLSE